MLVGERLEMTAGRALDPRDPGTLRKVTGTFEEASGMIKMAIVQKRLGGVERDLRAGRRG